MRTASKAVLARIRGKGRGWVFSAKDFLDLGSRTAVDQALSRFARANKIRRLRRGIYDFPLISQIVGVVPPSGAKVAAAIGRKLKDGLQVDPALAANSLGLSMQVPARQVYFTSGPSRTINAGGTVVELKHAGASWMIGAGKPAGIVLQASVLFVRVLVMETIGSFLAWRKPYQTKCCQKSTVTLRPLPHGSKKRSPELR